MKIDLRQLPAARLDFMSPRMPRSVEELPLLALRDDKRATEVVKEYA